MLVATYSQTHAHRCVFFFLAVGWCFLYYFKYIKVFQVAQWILKFVLLSYGGIFFIFMNILKTL